MKESEKQLQSLIQRAELRERTARKRAIVYSLVPILLAATLLWFTRYRIIQYQKEAAQYQEEAVTYKNQAAEYQVVAAGYKNQAAEYQKEAAGYKKQVAELKQSLDEIEKRLRQSTKFARHIRKVDWRMAKLLYSRYPRQAELFNAIRSMRDEGIGWELGGKSPEEGFDSPSFAAYVLAEMNLLEVPFSARYRLRELIKETKHPEVGDLIFYETGYTMFYFHFKGYGRPFCVGMTPAGIVALEIEFGPRLLGYGKVRYVQ